LKKRKLAGILLILCGIVFAAAPLFGQYLYCLEMWTGEFKESNFTSFWDYYFTVSKALFLICAGICALGVYLGSRILLGKNNAQKQ
jgi:hypothetical protein